MAKEEDWEKIEPAGFWNPAEEGDELKGQVLAIIDGQFGSHYKIKKDDGTEILTPAHKVLLNRLATVKEGHSIRIVYDGEQPPKVRGQNPTKMYTVYLRKA
jgi:hypothetical protein